MFESEVLARVVELQQKSYLLLHWVGSALQSGTVRFSTIHDSLSGAEAAKEWVGRTYESLPADTRPNRSDLDAFGHLFASYLQTSFMLVAQPGQKLVSSHGGCYCGFCAYLVSANHLRVRQPDKKAHGKARQMKALYLSTLATETVGAVSYSVLEPLLSDPAFSEDLAFATYGYEPLRRAEFASQGEGILVLWREIAWDERGKLKKNFVLSAERILRAESRLRTGLVESVHQIAKGGAL